MALGDNSHAHHWCLAVSSARSTVWYDRPEDVNFLQKLESFGVQFIIFVLQVD